MRYFINYKFLSENSFLHMINWSLIIFSILTFLISTLLISTFLISTFSINAFSQEIKSTNEVKSYLPNSKEVGSGFYSFMGFKVYQAHYFVEDDVGMGGFALSLDYLRAISKEDLTKATIKQMLRIGASEEQANTWKSQLEKFFPDVDKGQRITAIHVPKTGTIFIHDGKIIGKILSDEFSRLFFGVWFDIKTSAPELRSSLLAELCPPILISRTCSK